MFLSKLWELMVGPKDDYPAQLRSVLILGLIISMWWMFNNSARSDELASHISKDEATLKEFRDTQTDMDKEIDEMQILLHEIHANQKVMMDILQGKYRAIQ